MASTRRQNYKSKWLAALRDGQKTSHEVARAVAQQADTVEGTHLSAARELESLHQVLIEGGLVARQVCEMLDDTRHTGPVQFREFAHGIDEKISNMPSKVIARRMRDALRVSEERIAILSEVCNDQCQAIADMVMRSSTLEIGNRGLQKALLQTAVLGRGHSQSDVEDYIANPHRRKSDGEYSGLSDEITLLTHTRQHIPSDDEDYSSDDDDLALTANRDHVVTAVGASRLANSQERSEEIKRNIVL